uniref:Uncharacterized protein n=1 Tax=Rhizophora mucronata TaxID=61149 RepID=A0A2P2R419_RHIMU
MYLHFLLYAFMCYYFQRFAYDL